MKSRNVLLRRFLLVVAVCLSILAIAHADNFSSSAAYDLDDVYGVVCCNLIPGYNTLKYDSGYGEIYFTEYGMPDLAGGELSYDTLVLWSYVYSSGQFNGGLGYGSFVFGDSSYLFEGTVTGGWTEGSFYGNYQEDYITFAGSWNDGAPAIGTYTGYYNVPGIGYQGYINVELTPEPGTMVLFGSAVVAIAGVLRRGLRT
jgi:PEP-CTERM motif